MATTLDADFIAKLDRLRIRMANRRSAGDSRRIRPRRTGHSLEFADYRRYQPGDDFRDIDWNVYRRLNQVYLRAYSHQEDAFVHIIIDASGSIGEGTPPKIELLRRIALAVTYVAVADGNWVEVHGFNADHPQRFGPIHRRPQVPEAAEFVDRLTPGGQTHLNRWLHETAVQSRRPGPTLVLTDLLDEAGYEEGIRSLQRRGFDVVVVQVNSPQEIAGPRPGFYRLVDVETDRSIEQPVNTATRERYIESRRSREAAAHDFARRHRVEFHPVVSNESIEDVVLGRLRGGILLS